MGARVLDKVTIITGAGEGIGRTMTELFSREGAKVVLAGRRRDPLEAVGATLQTDHLVVPTDITDETQVAAMVRDAVAHFGHVDILLNNAAQPGTDKYLWEQTLENWNQNIAVNVTGPMLCTREVLKQSMLERKSGAIVNFSSIASWQGRERKSHYCVSKSGLRLLTKVAAKEAGPYGIRVNCLVPGATKTDLLVRYLNRIAGEQNSTPEAMADKLYLQQQALKQINTAEQVASAALFLASDDASGITGQSVPVDAGNFMLG